MPKASKNKFHRIDHNSLTWKAYLVYDIFMMFIIIFNLFCITSDAILMSHFAHWFATLTQHSDLLEHYRAQLHPWVERTDSWFICFLVIELLIRWGIAIVKRYHQKWFFFPFIHWYEVLAIFPQFRFLRLLRAGFIAYRLQEIGYQIIPQSWQEAGRFYYSVVMEELSDRVVITLIDGVKQELDTSSTHKAIIHDMVNRHRPLFAEAFAQVLQETLSTELKKQQVNLSQNMGKIIEDSISNTPEIHHLLRLFPIVGNRIEDHLKVIAKRLTENVVKGIISPLTEGDVTNPNYTYRLISNTLSEVNISNHSLEQLVESIVYESLNSIRKQVKVKQWQQILHTKEHQDNH
ncbi:hypothetical protein P256_01110 [Acinetobacter nectaris CIP 110549]|uniref:Preprotein translocase subunit SecA n=1 Tax=Acinetobacter nectaris CIP 110549 TaxID=1392540 RepID=V2TXP6_9GAMM|nr:hypothetical protein [Acinetobacter nectaris]ESK40655.1 hypothetical protein P256_01110 [Acinetobacter nectaris CIP 110549]